MILRNRKRLSYEKIKARYGYVFISLWLIGFVFLFFVPFINAVIYSFNDLTVSPGKVAMEFTGFDNYRRALTEDADFFPYFFGTLSNTIFITPVVVLFSLFVSILLNQKFKGRMIARAIFFLPVIIMSGSVISAMNYDSFFASLVSGVRASSMLEAASVGDILKTLGINQSISDYIVQVVNQLFNIAWISGTQILIFLSGLQAIPDSYYEVAQIEGATSWESFWKVTLPSIGPMIVVNIVYTMYDSLLTGGEMFSKIQMHINEIDFAYAAALAMMSFIVWAALIVSVYLAANRYVHYTTN